MGAPKAMNQMAPGDVSLTTHVPTQVVLSLQMGIMQLFLVSGAAVGLYPLQRGVRRDAGMPASFTGAKSIWSVTAQLVPEAGICFRTLLLAINEMFRPVVRGLLSAAAGWESLAMMTRASETTKRAAGRKGGVRFMALSYHTSPE